MRLAARRVPMLFVGLLSMACGMWLGLVRLGWNLPLPWQDQLIAHGPLMVCGFLGTLISLERAVALGSRWGYAAPVLVAAGALMLDLGPLGAFGPMLITAGSLVMVAIFVVVWRRQRVALRRDDDDWRAGLDGRQRAVARRRADLSRRVLVAGVPGADDRRRAARAESGVAADACRPLGVRPGDGDGPGRRRRGDVVAGAGRPRAGRGAHRADVVAGASRRRAADGPSARRHAVHGGLPPRRLRVAGRGRRHRGRHRRRDAGPAVRRDAPCRASSGS